MFNNNPNELFSMLKKQHQQENTRNNLEISPEKWLSLSDLERSNYLYQQRKNGAYKTSLCRYWKNKRICNYGEQCRFAHGIHELLVLRPRHPKHKTQLCKNYIYDGTCEYSSRCQFIHREMSWMPMPPPQAAVVNPNNYVPTIPSYSSVAKSGLPIQQPQVKASTMAGNPYIIVDGILTEWFNVAKPNHVANFCYIDTSDDFHLPEYFSRSAATAFGKSFN
uniref:C3H1-type domain-containing protein n=1 Tax=Panagrolaimus davidi TaxID=227884 RepID=A0A914P790_9BILA